MSSTLRRLAGSGLVLVAAAVAAGGGAARTANGPFNVIPGPRQTNQCKNLAFCRGIAGLWVVVPAGGEATFLFGCPVRKKALGDYLLGGTDARTSSKHVHVWFDGKLGSLALPAGQNGPDSGLLFHAVSDDGKAGSFQPVLGCISLRQATKRSTVSARQAQGPGGTVAPPAARLRAQMIVLEPGQDRTTTLSCSSKETLIGSWSAVAYGTEGPPVLPPAGAVTAQTTDVGRTVHAVIHTEASVPHLIRIQIGAMCER